jgi:signal transduction histidine kinase
MPTTLLTIGRDSFLKVLGRSPSLGIRVLVRLTTRLRETDQQAIAELRRSNQELTNTLKQLGRLDRTKTDFIRVSAHELRTPVAALVGYAQMMQSDPTVHKTPHLQTLVDGIVASTSRLHRVFNSILDLSRLMSEDAIAHHSPVSIAITISSICTEFSAALQERSLSMELKGLQKLPFCKGDPDMLYKAFYHLVNNAIKYTPDGGRITVTGQEVELPGEGKFVEVTISDSGIGVAAEDLDLIFEKFYRTGEIALHSSGTTKFKGGGPGLGLAIARGVVVAHSGRIWAESPGYDEATCPGSRFIVQLPADPGNGKAR